MKAIETRYAGCRFRSRLEARWAVFFDAAGIEWQYEPQGFRFAGRSYLPDFRITDSAGVSLWVEVKGEERALDKTLMANAARALPGAADTHSGAHYGFATGGLLVLGDVPRPMRGARLHTLITHRVGAWHDALLFDCTGGRSVRFIVHALDCDGPIGTESCCDGWVEPDLVHPTILASCNHAYQAARSARFEHGETA